MSEDAMVPTQSALLERREERAGLREGFRFLDEKRLILAAEMLAEIARYEREQTAFEADYASAVQALQAALARHGLEGLGLYPAIQGAEGGIERLSRTILGVPIQEVRLAELPPGPPPDTLAASPEADACRALFGALIPRAVRLAAMVANLERLRADYSRAARRARALEDVLLPEVEDRIKGIESALEELEREEAVRARRGGGDGAHLRALGARHPAGLG